MKKLLLLGTLALAGCTGTGALPPSTGPGILSPLVSYGVISEDTRTKARQVQATTKGLCQFIPTIGTIASIFSAGIGEGVASVASGICSAVTTAPLADGGPRQAKVNGVVIRGRFVK